MLVRADILFLRLGIRNPIFISVSSFPTRLIYINIYTNSVIEILQKIYVKSSMHKELDLQIKVFVHSFEDFGQLPAKGYVHPLLGPGDHSIDYLIHIGNLKLLIVV